MELLFGESGLNVLHKAFGIILLAISIKLFRTNTGIFKIPDPGSQTCQILIF